MESNSDLHTQVDHSNLATRRSFLARAAFASASLASLTVSGKVKINPTWSSALNFVQEGAIGDVRYISAIGPAAKVMEAYTGALCMLAPAREVTSEESSHPATGAFSMRCDVEGGAQIAVASVSGDYAERVTIQGTDGSIHIVGEIISVQSRGAWRELVA